MSAKAYRSDLSDYERKVKSAEAFLRIAGSVILLNRLSRLARKV